MKIFQSAILSLFALVYVEGWESLTQDQWDTLGVALCASYPQYCTSATPAESSSSDEKIGNGVEEQQLEAANPENIVYNNRKLASSDEALQACAEFDYTISAAVLRSHVIAFAEPRCNAGPLRNDQGCEKCGNFVIHSPDVDNFLVKEMVAVHKEAPEIERHPVGTVPLGKLVEAFDNTPVDASPYSWSKNNCGSFLIALGKNLGIHPTEESIRFVSRKLYENAGSYVVDKISGSGARGDENEDAVIHNWMTEYIHARL